MKLSPHEIKKAKNWYLWLWFSPVFTIPTLFFMFYTFHELSNILCPNYSCHPFLEYIIAILIPVLISALWHLILLIPALNKECSFVRWHGRQALMLAGIRTIVPMVLALWDDDYYILSSIPVLFIIWLVGNIWGRRQASNGQCSLMRWFGHQIPPMEPEPAVGPHPETSSDPDLLVEIFRFNPDSQKKKNALEELKRLGLVEHFDNE